VEGQFSSWISLPWALAFFFSTVALLMRLSHRKTHWTVSVHNVGLIICVMGTSNSKITLFIFIFLSKCILKWSLGRVQQPITDFTKPLR
jgi:hypothetical protein